MRTSSYFVLAAFVSVVSAACLQAQPIKPLIGDLTQYDRAAVRAALAKWGRSMRGFNRNRPTILIATSINQCSGCCATAANVITRVVAGFGLDANVLVVIAADAPGEGLVLRKQFIAANVTEDVGGVLESVFAADQTSPDLYIVDTTGRVAMRHRDIQHNASIEYTDILAAGLRPVPPEIPVIISRGVQLAESATSRIVDAVSASLNGTGTMLSFVEPHYNAVYSFNARTGKQTGNLNGFDSLKFRYRDPKDDPRGWNLVDSLYRPMVSVVGLARGHSSDSLLVMADLFTGYQSIDTTGPRPKMMMKKNRAIIAVRNNTVHGIRLLPSAPVQLGDVMVIGKDSITSLVIDEAQFNENEARRDTSNAICIFNLNTGESCRIASLATMDSATLREFQPLITGSLVPAGTGRMFYVSEGNRAFLSIVQRASGYVLSRIEPAGTLLQLFTAHGSGDSALVENVSLLDAMADSRFLYLLMEDKRRMPATSRLVVQRYMLNGDFHSERAVRSRNDEVLNASLAGFDGQDLVALVKWKKARWSIERMER